MISLSKGLISKNTTSLYSVHGAKTGEPTATSGMTTKVHAPKPNFWCPSLCLQQLAGPAVRGGVLPTSRPVRPDLLPVCLPSSVTGMLSPANGSGGHKTLSLRCRRLNRSMFLKVPSFLHPIASCTKSHSQINGN